MNHNVKVLFPFNGLLFFHLLRKCVAIIFPGWLESHPLFDYSLSGITIFFLFWFVFHKGRMHYEKMSERQMSRFKFLWRACLGCMVFDCIVGLIPPTMDYQIYTTILMSFFILAWFLYQGLLFWRKII